MCFLVIKLLFSHPYPVLVVFSILVVVDADDDNFVAA